MLARSAAGGSPELIVDDGGPLRVDQRAFLRAGGVVVDRVCPAVIDGVAEDGIDLRPAPLALHVRKTQALGVEASSDIGRAAALGVLGEDSADDVGDRLVLDQFTCQPVAVPLETSRHLANGKPVLLGSALGVADLVADHAEFEPVRSGEGGVAELSRRRPVEVSMYEDDLDLRPSLH